MSTEIEYLTGIVRGVMAGLLIVAFLLLGIWVFAAKRRNSFETVARLPLEEDTDRDPAT
jgi:cbb3-type cytochrome oxidase subunit 3